MKTVFTLSSNLLRMFRENNSLIQNNHYNEVIEKVNAIVADQNLSQQQKDDFLNQKAVALCDSGKQMEGLSLLLELLERSPTDIGILSSIRAIISKLASKTCEILKDDTKSEEIIKIESLMLSLDNCPGVIRLHVAKLKALKGEKDEPLMLVKSYLKLSPNDEDYLRAAVEIAEITGDKDYKSSLIARINELIKKYPFRFELTELVDDCCA